LQRKLIPSRRQREDALGAADPNLMPIRRVSVLAAVAFERQGVVAHDKT
jgi:hypothetical protein